MHIHFNNLTFQISFEAVRGNAPASDIAIDDFKIKEGECPPPGDALTQLYIHIYRCSFFYPPNDSVFSFFSSLKFDKFLTKLNLPMILFEKMR